MIVLGIETSCDETAVALYGDNGLLSHRVFSQIPAHQIYGGVVPEVAARDHVVKLLPLIDGALCDAGVSTQDLSAVAYTVGPGLVGALMVGASMGCALAYALKIPAIEIHHMEAHLMAVMMEQESPEYPFLALLVSGGHSLLVQVESFGRYQILGQSVDDAVGEAFDKTAKLLGLDYPGGPALAKLAEVGTPGRFRFPRPMANKPGLNFSFSGLKTAVANKMASFKAASKQDKSDIAYAFQEAAVDTLLTKLKLALEQTGLNQVAVVGGVSANQHLRERCHALLDSFGGKVYFPRLEWCTDNGAMVAFTGYQRCKLSARDNLRIRVKARWPIDSL